MVLVFSHTGFKSVLSTLLFSLLGHIQRTVSAFLIYFRYQKSLVFSFYQVETDLNQNFLPRFSLKLSSRPFSPACCLLISIVVGGAWLFFHPLLALLHLPQHFLPASASWIWAWRRESFIHSANSHWVLNLCQAHHSQFWVWTNVVMSLPPWSLLYSRRTRQLY